MSVTSHTNRVAAILQIDGTQVSYQSVITMQGLEMLASYLAAPYSYKLPFAPFIAIGQGENGPSTEQRQLENELWRKIAISEDGGVRYGLYSKFEIHEPADDYILREVGVFDQLAGGHMIKRFVTEVDVEIDAADALEVMVYLYVEEEDG